MNRKIEASRENRVTLARKEEKRAVCQTRATPHPHTQQTHAHTHTHIRVRSGESTLRWYLIVYADGARPDTSGHEFLVPCPFHPSLDLSRRRLNVPVRHPVSPTTAVAGSRWPMHVVSPPLASFLDSICPSLTLPPARSRAVAAAATSTRKNSSSGGSHQQGTPFCGFVW